MSMLIITAPDKKEYEVPVADGQTPEQARDHFQKTWEEYYGGQGQGQGQHSQEQTAAPETPAAPLHEKTLARAAGLTARAGIEWATALPSLALDVSGGIMNKLRGEGPVHDNQAKVSSGLTDLGFPEPETSTERGVNTAFQVGADVLTGRKVLADAAKGVVGATKKLYNIASGKAATEAIAATGGAVADLTKGAIAAAEARAVKAAADATKQTERAKLMGQHRQNIQKLLDTPAKPGESLEQIGAAARGAMLGAVGGYEAVRSAQGAKDVAAVLEQSRVLEAKGKFLNTTSIVAPLKTLEAATKDIPTVGAEVSGMLQMFGQSSRQQQQAHAFLDMSGKPLFDGAQAAPLTMEKAEHVRRKLSDMAYGVGPQKQGTSVQKAARDALHELDAQMGEFVPAHKVFKENWRNNSRPLDVLDTKFANFLTDAKGGVDGTAYHNLHPSELPKKFFEKQGGMELLTDALAGGKAGDAAITAEARAHAAAQVDNMALKYFQEMGRGMTAERKAQFVANPVNRGVMERLPAAKAGLLQGARQEQKLRGGLEAVKANESNALKYVEEAKTTARAERAAGMKLQGEIAGADAKFATKEPKLVREALGEYRSVLEQAQAHGAITREQYKLALDLVARANGSVEKAARLHKISGIIARWAAAGAAGAVGVMGVRAIH